LPNSTTLKNWIVPVALILGGAFFSLCKPGEAHVVARVRLESFPSEVGSWRQVESAGRFNEEAEEVLSASDYLLREYETREGRGVGFFVAYYEAAPSHFALRRLRPVHGAGIRRRQKG
jgi:hypothetical protein